MLTSDGGAQSNVDHYVYFNRNRERIHETSFWETGAFVGAQLKYACNLIGLLPVLYSRCNRDIVAAKPVGNFVADGGIDDVRGV